MASTAAASILPAKKSNSKGKGKAHASAYEKRKEGSDDMGRKLNFNPSRDLINVYNSSKSMQDIKLHQDMKSVRLLSALMDFGLRHEEKLKETTQGRTFKNTSAECIRVFGPTLAQKIYDWLYRLSSQCRGKI